MDKLTLKSIIIELRDSGMSFSDISNELKEKYGIKMTRQAVCGMYSRATSDKSITKAKNLILVTSDILNYYCIGLSTEDIKELLSVDVSIADINKTIKSNAENINTIRKNQLNKIVNSIVNGADINDIRKILSFKGIQIDEKVFNKLVEMASETYVMEAIAGNILNIYNMSNDKKLTKKLMDKFNIHMNFSELGRYQRLNRINNNTDFDTTVDDKENTIGITINNGLIAAKV